MISTVGLTDFSGSDWLRLFNFVLSVGALIIMATRLDSFFRLPTHHRFHWLSTLALVGSITYSNVELYLADTQGGYVRLTILACALVYLHITLYTARGSSPVLLVPTDTSRRTAMQPEPYDPTFDGRTAREGEPDHPTTDEAPPAPPVSPKVTAASLGSLAAGVLLAVILAVASPEGQTVVGGLPPVVTFLLTAALPPVAAFLAGFAVPNTVSYLQPALRAARYKRLKG